jgi:hypothetical protein
MNETALRQLRELHSLWNKIERRAKDAEQFRGDSIIAAINEMRYAGRRIVDVLGAMHLVAEDASTNDDDIAENLIVAKTYLINADHDITDAICFSLTRASNERSSGMGGSGSRSTARPLISSSMRSKRRKKSSAPAAKIDALEPPNMSDWQNTTFQK